MKLTIFIVFSVIVIMIREIYIMAADERKVLAVKKEITKVISKCKTAKDILAKMLGRRESVAAEEPVVQADQDI